MVTGLDLSVRYPRQPLDFHGARIVLTERSSDRQLKYLASATVLESCHIVSPSLPHDPSPHSPHASWTNLPSSACLNMSLPQEHEQRRPDDTLSVVRAELARPKYPPSTLQQVISSALPKFAAMTEPVLMSKPAPEGRTRSQGMEPVTAMSKSQLVEERGRRMAARYGLEINAFDLQPGANEGTVLRVHKPIRMRIRPKCHLRRAGFAVNRECPGCRHARCTNCFHCPARSPEPDQGLKQGRRATFVVQAYKQNPRAFADSFYDLDNLALKRPSKTGGQELVYKKPRQRVRRTCHECQTQFRTGGKRCDGCNHIRCTDCPRDPARTDKYPFGYPGDVFGPNSIPRYECEHCKALFRADAEVEPEPDPEILKSIMAKLDRLAIA
ncbi:hypothetical protein RJ55_08006 [Drechmeria coniospora]|nr:hypothetical protein RJ55_08006 [Drechmeria coniospora]